MALSTILFLALALVVAAHLLVRFQHERRRGKLVWGRLVIPFGKTAEWLLYFWAMVFAIVHLSKNLPQGVDNTIDRARPAQTAGPGRLATPKTGRNPRRPGKTGAATKKPQAHERCGL